MEVVITKKKQTNSDIELNHIYDAIRNLKPEQQMNILANYKFIELYDILSSKEAYEKYINDLFAVSHEYTNKAIALISLHTESVLQSMGKQSFDILDSMGQAYDSLSDIDKKIFCNNMLQKKGFFQNAYKVMMGVFENAVESGKCDSMEENYMVKELQEAE